MLFQHLPPAVIVPMLIVCCLVKHIAMRKIVHLPSFKKAMIGDRWFIAIATLAIAGSLSILYIFAPIVSWSVAAKLAVLDGLLHVVTGIYARLVRLFHTELSWGNKLSWVIHGTHGVYYLAIVQLAVI